MDSRVCACVCNAEPVYDCVKTVWRVCVCVCVCVCCSSHMQDLKDVTRDVHYENYRAKHIQQQLNNSQKERKSVSLSFVLSLASTRSNNLKWCDAYTFFCSTGSVALVTESYRSSDNWLVAQCVVCQTVLQTDRQSSSCWCWSSTVCTHPHLYNEPQSLAKCRSSYSEPVIVILPPYFLH